MKQLKHTNNRKCWLTSLFFAAGLSGSAAQATQLNLADEPLFLGISVDPNVFFELDDSGSMDWEVLTVPYYRACQYDRDAPINPGSHNCATSKISSGNWETTRGYYDRGTLKWLFRSFYYIYNSSDNVYGTGCNRNSYNYSLESCGTKVVELDWRGLAADFNVIYYNPRSSYKPWAGTGLLNAKFSEARSNPQPAIPAISAQAQTSVLDAVPAQGARSETDGYSLKRDLTGFVYHVWIDSHGFSDSYPKRGSNINRKDGANGLVDLWDNYYVYTVNATEVSWKKMGWEIESDGSLKPKKLDEGSFSGSATDPNITPARTVAEIQQNIANWYSFSRKRSYVTKGAVGAVVTASPTFRFGQTLLNRDDLVFNSVPPASVSRYNGYNTSLLNDLYSYKWRSNGTPLRKGLDTAGRYYDGVLSGKVDPIIESCQQNFTVLFTDGYWNGHEPWTSGLGDNDGDGINKTVADVAKFYYDNDLSPLRNEVVPSTADPATYQHMVTFPVAFGVKGSIIDSDGDGWPDPSLDVSDKWGLDPFSYNLGKIDDLWHAAYNSKGEFVAAQTPDDVVNSLVSALGEISSRDASASAVATSTGQISSTTAIFQAQFNNGDWSGKLYSLPILPDFSVDIAHPNWEAGEVLNTLDYDTGRAIITHNGTQGVPFRMPVNYKSPTATELSSAQVAQLMNRAPYALSTADSTETAANQSYGQSLIDYLRGDRSKEGVSAVDFRQRSTLLGDIVDSNPQYVREPRFFYPDSLESVPYSNFKTAKASRPKMVYVGANDGMLHGFDASTGRERLAYVPNLVFDKLSGLTEVNFKHKFLVNGAPTVVDAFYSNGWHSVLVGTLGHGGQGVYSLDVSSPGSFSETSAGQVSQWEFSDHDDADMGYSIGQASIAKMANGKWAAVFGNGYNNTEADGHASTTGHAVLYIVDLANGNIIKKIDTGVGSATTPNGLASPTLVDLNNDYVVDYIYAGDLQGNLWKFDVTDTNAGDWGSAWANKPLFKAASGQAITTRPSVGYHPERGGQLVYFGTGKYLEPSDNSVISEPTQSFYAIWDKNESSSTNIPVAASNLLAQEILAEFSQDFNSKSYNIRLTSKYEVNWSNHDGWKLDLVNKNATTVNNNGERQVTDSLLHNGRIIFTTAIPSDSPCSPGGKSWLMELDAGTGARLVDSPFDLDDDGEFGKSDRTYNSPTPINHTKSNLITNVPPSGIQGEPGLMQKPSVIIGKGTEGKYMPTSKGSIVVVKENPGPGTEGRQSWRELD